MPGPPRKTQKNLRAARRVVGAPGALPTLDLQLLALVLRQLCNLHLFSLKLGGKGTPKRHKSASDLLHCGSERKQKYGKPSRDRSRHDSTHFASIPVTVSSSPDKAPQSSSDLAHLGESGAAAPRPRSPAAPALRSHTDQIVDGLPAKLAFPADQNPVGIWSTQSHASRIKKPDIRGYLWLGSSLTNLQLPGF